MNSFEKNYREKKTRQGDKGTGTEGDGADKETGETGREGDGGGGEKEQSHVSCGYQGFSAAIKLRSAAAQISLALVKPSSLNVNRCSSTVMK